MSKIELRWICRHWIIALCALIVMSQSSSLIAQQDVGFIEDFALASDREKVLQLLIPGTEDYYYYHALHFQNERKLKELNRILGEWKNRFRNSGKRKQIENREALFRYSDDPEATLAYLRREMGLTLNHQQEGKAREVKYPSTLDPKFVSWKSFLDDALGRSSSLQNLQTSGFYRFLEGDPKLSTSELRDLLSRSMTPDLPRLVSLIHTDLKSKESKGFGEFRIHRLLTKAQLEELLALKADVINSAAFVETYLTRLLPNSDESMVASQSVREAYLTRAERFVATLPASFNSLKVHILYQRLSHDRVRGKENEQRFLDYLALPRNVSYLNPKWREKEPVLWRHPADLGRDYRKVTTLPSAQGGDEPLVKSYLLKFLKDDRDTTKFSPYLGENWLRRVFAESKITNGIGKPSDWAALLSPSEFQALKDRVEIEFNATNQEIHAIDDDVILKMHLKNVPKLIVKVFEINTLNYYRSLGNEVSTDIDLDGLVANFRESHEFDAAPQLKTEKDFKIAGIPNRRGLWVVEFIGGGKSSRAIIRKGALGLINRTVPQGELVTILDEANQPLKGAALWIGKNQYESDKSGRLVLPFSNSPGIRSVVIQDSSGYATMAKLALPREEYRITAGMHLDQESFRSGGKGRLILRPTLEVAGQTISLSEIESAALELKSTDLEGFPARMSVEDLKLVGDREFVHEFRVPDRLANLVATLRVKMKVASRGGEIVELTDSRSFKVNEVLKSDLVGDLYLSKIDGKYRIESFGRNAEPIAGQNLNVIFNHQAFKNQRKTTLKTTQRGSLDLGALIGISSLTVEAPSGKSRTWILRNDRRDQIENVTLSENQQLKVPFVGSLNRREVALYSLQFGGFVADEFSRLKFIDGYLVATLSPGDYRLILKPSDQSIKVLVGSGMVSQGYLFNSARMLELPARQASHLKSVKANDKTLEVEVSGLDPLTRVHVMATRFIPENDPFAALGGSQRVGLRTGMARFLPSLYISGRNLGDELRYILERRDAQKFAGNMLSRPEILLNPWAVRDTESGGELLRAGDKFNRKPVPAAAPGAPRRSAKKVIGSLARSIGSSSYEFLGRSPVVIPNLIPNKNGRISVKIDAFGDRQHVHVLLVDPEGATYRSVSLPDAKTKIRDLRLLTNALDPKRHFTEQEQVTILKKGNTLKIPDLLNSAFEVYDHLGSVHRYFLTLKNDSTLREFSFIAEWDSLAVEEKQSKYSKYACHELSFFISRKDPVFFKEVVRPHLANKKDLTFMDDYLLGNPLPKYYQSFEYARLNVVERILLAQSDRERMAALGLDLENRLALRPPNLDSTKLWFGAAVGGGAFGNTYAGEKLGIVAEADGISASNSVNLSFGKGFLDAREEASVSKNAGKQLKKQESALTEVESKYSARKRQAEVDPFAADLNQALQQVKQAYRALERTKEWAEDNYYHLPQSDQTYELVSENRFWLDLARHGVGPGFGSRYLGEVSGSFTEMMFALSFLDLPFKAPKHEDQIEEGALEFTAGGNVLFFHREVKEAGMADNRPPLLVNQSYFQLNDRFRMEDGQKIDKFVTQEFVRGVVYGAQVVVTNPTSARQRLDILSQIPKGAIAVRGLRSTVTQRIQLEPYSTHRLETSFYFPASGQFASYPAHLSKSGAVIAHADGLTFKVVDKPTSIDQTSWAWMSQWGNEADVLEYLEKQNLHAIDLTKMAWRCRDDKKFFGKALEILNVRGLYHPVIQGYSVAHNHKEGVAQLLLMQERFLDQCGVALSCDLLTVDPVNRRRYEHLEYKPLINNRAHALGGENRILNPVVRGQYSQFLRMLSQQKDLDDLDHLATTYYLFIQDRVAEALAQLKQVKPAKLETRMQYDYFQAYGAFYEADLPKARRLATKYEEYPVDLWRDRFADLTAQIKELQGAQPEVMKEGDREQEQQLAAALEPSLSIAVEGVQATLDFQNVSEVTINYYEMDLEFLFSTNPFVSSGTSRFAIIQPNKEISMKLQAEKGAKVFQLPAEYLASNVIVEVIGGGKKASAAVYANELKTTLSDSMGLLTVHHKKTGKPLPKVYVKVYADTAKGVKFFKDGYTDLRGNFDYASVSSTGIGEVRKFSVLVMSEEQGATVLEASVPQQ
ncbi:hypothetical protein N8577_01910 [Akkermansiaceae bacterium]|nr:hypothetical protein [Akkermansiaceae bacterium]